MKTKYFKEIDYLKGLAIIFVIIGHSFPDYLTGFTNSFNEFVFYTMYSFHMPLFFLISGFLITKNLTSSFKEKIKNIKHKFWRLFIPYLIFTFFTLFLKLIFSNLAMNEFHLKDIYKIFISDNPNGGLWFLYVLFLISIIVILLLDEKKYKTYLFFLLSLILLFISNFIPEYIYFLTRLLRNLPFFVLGIITNYHYLNIKKFLSKNYYILPITILTTCLLVSKMDFAIYNIYMLVLAISGIISSYIIISFVKDNSRISKVLTILSNNAMAIYLLSYFVSIPFKLVATKILIPYYLMVILNIFISCTIPILINKYIIKNNKILNLLLLGNLK